MNELAEVLKSAREKRGLTQNEVAKMAGITRSYYADVEHGRYAPSVKILARLASHLKINLNFLKKNVGNTRENK